MQHCRTVLLNVPAYFVSWARHMAQCSKICAKAAEQCSKGIPHFCLHWAEGAGRKQPQLYLHHQYWWQILGVWVWPWDQAAVVSVEDSNFTVTEESTTSSEQCQIDVGFVFDIEGNVHKEFFPSRQTVNGNYYCDILRQLREIIRSKHPDNGATTLGPRIMTMLWLTRHSLCSSFWLLQRQQSSPTLPTHQTSPPVIFSYSQRWNWSSRGDVLTALTRSRLNHRTGWWCWCDDFQQCFQSWKFHWDHCINAEGGYFNGDGGEQK